MCDACGTCPIIGTRYQAGVADYCEECKSKLPLSDQTSLVAHRGPKEIPRPDYVEANPSYKTRFLLVIDSAEHDWKEIFAGATLPCGSCIQVEQCGWQDLSLSAQCENGDTSAMCTIRTRHGRGGSFMYRPDFLLLRNEVCSIPPHNYKNLLLGLQFAGIPSVNSLQSVYELIERPWAFSALSRLQKRLGKEAFPLITQYYYPGFKEMQLTPEYPIVAKIAHGQAGYGKMKCDDNKVFQDLGSVMAMNTHYATAEPFLEGEYDIRIQKVGTHYRCWKRVSMSGEWKTNTGTSLVTPLELTAQYRMWADEASTLFGGMDILTVDALHTADGQDHILEVNGSSSGFMPASA